MRRSTLNERQKCVALLIATGQYTYQEIAKQAGIHFNSITRWVKKDERFQALVTQFQEDIAQKLEDMALESMFRKNSPLIQKATSKLNEMLEGKSQRKQMDAIQFLLNGPTPHQDTQKTRQERPSLIRLEHRPGKIAVRS